MCPICAYASELIVSSSGYHSISGAARDICAGLSSSCSSATLGALMQVHLPPPYLVLFGQWLLLRIMLLQVGRTCTQGQRHAPREHTCGFVGRALVWSMDQDNVLSESPAPKSGLDCRSGCPIRDPALPLPGATPATNGWFQFTYGKLQTWADYSGMWL